MSGKHAVEDQRQQDVASRGSRSLPVNKSSEAILRPSNLLFELVEREGLGAQQRRRGAARDVVTDKVEDVNEDGEEEGDGECTGTNTSVSK
jgi:hypothetical protein